MSKEDNSSEKIKPTSIRITKEEKQLLKLIAKHDSRSEGKSVGVMIREKAAALGITAPN